jgi:flotillin
MRYRVAEPNSYLAVTGVGIDNVQITRKSWVVPFQKMIKVSTTPLDFSMALQAMTNDKLQVSC